MHFLTYVLIDPAELSDNPSASEVEAAAAPILAPFDEQLEIENDERTYFDDSDITKIREHGGLSDISTAEATRRALEDYFGYETQIDEDGQFFYTSIYNPNGQWDWWQLGGRWSGTFDKDYDPQDDERNKEVCVQCSGTGTRPEGLERFGAEWVKEMNGCNGCKGTGISTKWPTSWTNDIGNWAKVSDIDLDDKSMLPNSMVTPDGVWLSKGWDADSDVDDEIQSVLEQHPDHIAVAVDCHC